MRSDHLVLSVPWHGNLPIRVRRRLAAMAIERRFAKGAFLYRAGDSADGLYIILSGRVRVSREFDGRSQLLHAEGAGGLLGEIPVFGGGTFPATARAAESTRCAHLGLDAVERLLREEPEFARFALRRMAIRAYSLLHRIDELTAMTITMRVARHVLARAKEAEASFTLGMSQEELADELGTAREVIVRSLSALVDAGSIERTGRARYAVTRMDMLRAMAS